MNTGAIYDSIATTSNSAWSNLWIVFFGIVFYLAFKPLGILLIGVGIYHFIKGLLR
jgi:hypothetical protein